MTPTPYIGQHIDIEGKLYEVTHKTPILSPYHRAGQDTRLVGWSLGLKRCVQQATPDVSVAHVLSMAVLAANVR